jgi:hypothetical protein
VLVIIVGVIEDHDGEIGRVTEGAADGEAIGRCRVNARGGGECVEAAKIDSPVWLKFVERFGHGGFSSLRSDSAIEPWKFRRVWRAKNRADSDVDCVFSAVYGL